MRASPFCRSRYTSTTNSQKPLKISDAPERFIELLRESSIGIEIQLERLEGRSSRRCLSPIDRASVIEGFANLGTKTSRIVSEIVKERGSPKDSQFQAANPSQHTVPIMAIW
ncbi:hypothetical protein F5B17DRAFT_415022 [Nemania serpens]|nr:hypothetical protein F5B17DRAFT_415022 [Nemania serpens]